MTIIIQMMGGIHLRNMKSTVIGWNTRLLSFYLWGCKFGLTLIYPPPEFRPFWNDDIFTFWHQSHEHNLHKICIFVFLFVS